MAYLSPVIVAPFLFPSSASILLCYVVFCPNFVCFCFNPYVQSSGCLKFSKLFSWLLLFKPFYLLLFLPILLWFCLSSLKLFIWKPIINKRLLDDHMCVAYVTIVRLMVIQCCIYMHVGITECCKGMLLTM